jgi:hypothetical protein
MPYSSTPPRFIICPNMAECHTIPIPCRPPGDETRAKACPVCPCAAVILRMQLHGHALSCVQNLHPCRPEVRVSGGGNPIHEVDGNSRFDVFQELHAIVNIPVETDSIQGGPAEHSMA